MSWSGNKSIKLRKNDNFIETMQFYGLQETHVPFILISINYDEPY